MTMLVPFPAGVTLATAWSSCQVSKNHDCQNQSRSRPAAASMLLKKSNGVGCFHCQSRPYWRKPCMKTSSPSIDRSMSSTIAVFM